nr:ABC transporter substrate-binding protein [Micromonospora sp. DSM 115978]
MRPLRTIALVAAATALVAGCGSDSGGEAPVDATVDLDAYQPGPADQWDTDGFTVDPAGLDCAGEAPNPTRGVTDTTVKVGGLAYLTSPNGSSMAGADVGAQVRFDRANDEGGVHGRTIEFIGVADDGQDAARNVQEAQKLVDQEEVFAVVPLMTTSPNFSDTLCEAVVPFFGWGFNVAYCDNALA